ncbi:phage tail tape measure protein [Vibrio cholerae]|nr:phage tail tape measure protein [Vibrio cholerae]
MSMNKQRIADLVARLSAETADFDNKIGGSEKKLGNFSQKAEKAEDSNEGLGKSLTEVSGKLALLPGPLGQVGGHLDNLTDNVGGLGAKWTLVAGSVAVAIGAMTAGLPTLAETERRLLQQEQLIKATGYASGYTAQELDELARSVAMNTLTSTQEAAKAIGVMLSFRAVMGSTFREAIMLSQDIASVWGTDMSGVAENLGEALNDPINGLTVLGSYGVNFTQTQKDMVEQMTKTGDVAAAQGVILDELRLRFGGGASAEASGLVGTVDTFSQTWEEMLESLSDKSGAMFFAKTTLQGLIDIMQGVKDFVDPEPMEEFNDLLKQRIELSRQIDEIESQSDGELPSISPFGLLGPSKNELFNLTVEYNMVTKRMMELQEEFKQKSIAQKEAQDKAAEAAKDREKQRIEEVAAEKRKKDAEEKQREDKRQKEREAAQKVADQKALERERETTEEWLIELDRRNLSEMQLINAKYMDDASRLAEKRQQDLITEEQYQHSLSEIQRYYASERTKLMEKEAEEQKKKNQTYMDKYMESMQKAAYDTDMLWTKVFDSFTSGFGQAFSSAILDSESASDAFQIMAEGMARATLDAIGQIMAQRLVMWTLQKTLNAGETASQVAQVTAEAQSASLLAGIHAYSSTAAIPITGPTLAPGAAAAAIAATEPMAAAATAAAAAGFAGMFDEGGFIPAGQWGITGELGPEITLGPTQVIGRKKTADLLQQAGKSANVGESSPSIQQTVEQHFHLSDVYGDAAVQAIIRSAAKEGADAAYQRVATDFATGRGIRQTLKRGTGL